MTFERHDPSSGDTERREFVRIRVALQIRYAFVGADGTRLPPGISEGASTNLSAGGLLLSGKLHEPAWAADLLSQKMAVAVSILLPTEAEPVKALARTAWIETIDPATRRCNMGLAFKEIPREDQDRIFRFVIKSQLG